MKEVYYCTDCGHMFIYSRHNIDGRCCPNCGGHVTPCTVGIDLASGKGQTSHFNAKSIDANAIKSNLNSNFVPPPSTGSSVEHPTYNMTINASNVKEFNDIVKSARQHHA